MDVLVPLVFNDLEIRSVLAELLPSDPVSPVEGRFWYNTTTHTLNFYNGSTVQSLQTEVFTATVHDARDHSAIASTIALNEIGAPSGNVDLNNHRITTVATPISGSDVAIKSYVDDAITGLEWKQAVRVATTVAGTLATSFENGDTVDGVVLATNDRILIKNQATGSENGIYTVNASGAPTRATDADANAEVKGGAAVWVNEGTANHDTAWTLTTNDPITVGSTTLTFTQFGGGISYTNGTGISIVGSTISVDTAVVSRKYSAAIGDGASTSLVVTHALGTRDVNVAVYRNSTPYDEIIFDCEHTDANNVTVKFAVAPSSNQFKCVVQG